MFRLVNMCFRFTFVGFMAIYTCFGQSDSLKHYKTIINGMETEVVIAGDDTTLTTQLDLTGILPLMQFDSLADQERYLKYRRYAFVVYPFAAHSVRLYQQVQEATKDMTEKERRKFVDQIDQALEAQFENTLKNLTRTQGLILTKMIERELDKPFHSVIKELRGGFAAFYWNQLGKFNGYKLKEKYTPGQDPVMDAVLEEFDMNKDLTINVE
ncbi:MAG: DUF4294 domain-containing protein [Saprospiraceae bacterium]|nr:DUF4294 domain-containing protein [Saprospiraceae bacterium]